MELRCRMLTPAERESGVERFLEQGFAVFEGLLSPAAVDEIVRLCDAVHRRFASRAAGSQSTSAFHGEGTRLLYNLHNKAPEFRELIFDPDVLALGDVLLKKGSYRDAEPYQLALSQARGLVGAHEPQPLHIDSVVAGAGLPLVMQAMWVLSDFKPGSGATRVVPGSQRRRGYAEAGRSYADECLLEAPRGTLVIFDGALWHGSSRKTTEDERWIVVNRYSRWFYRPSFDHTRNTPQEIFDTLTDRQKELLGFRFLPPVDEFTRVTRMREGFEEPAPYALPGSGDCPACVGDGDSGRVSSSSQASQNPSFTATLRDTRFAG